MRLGGVAIVNARMMFGVAASLCVSFAIHAQNSATAAPQTTSNPIEGLSRSEQPPEQTAHALVTLRQGTPVYMLSQSELSSKTARVGDRFELRVAEDVIVEGQIVIPAGTRGVGEVSRAEKKGMFGKSGKLDTRVLYARMGNININLAGSANDEGKGGTAGVVAAAVFLLPLAPFITGTSAVLPPGTRMTGWVENDLRMALGPAPPPPIVQVVRPSQ